MDCCTVVAELRPVIGSCQFFIKMDECKEVSKVITASNKITIKGSNDQDIAIIKIENTSIASDSISGLQVSDYSVQFRVRIEPNKIYGCFKNEMLFKEQDNTLFSSQSDCYKPDFETNEEVTIFCRICSTAFNNMPFKFKRILPLPTSFDTSDFFCHNNLSNNHIKLKQEDCLYGLCFVQINVHPVVESSDKVIFCCCCQAWLGVRERNCIIFWNSSIKFKDLNQENSGLNDFITVIKHTIRKDITISKILLYSRLTNDKINYLLIWVIEKSLSLLTNRNANAAKVFLQEQKVFKVLYLHEKEESDAVKTWDNDMNTSRIQISKQMMTEGLTHLKNMSQNISEDFREVNQMLVSYIMV